MLNNLQNMEAERSVIGSILYEPDLMDECTLTAKEFSTEAHRTLFDTFEKIAKQNQKVIPALIVEELGDRLQQVGGTGYLAQLAGSIATTADFEINVSIVRRCYLMRHIRDKMLSFVEDPDEDKVLEVAKELDSMIDSATDNVDDKSDREMLLDIYEDIFKDHGELSGITTGSHELDKMTSGLQDGELVIVAGRPAMGKSAFAINTGISAASRGTIVDLFSMEMPRRMVLQRIVSNVGRISGGKWKNPKRLMSQQDISKVANAIDEYLHWKMKIHGESSQTVSSIRSVVRKSMKQYPKEKHLVIIDYLSFMDVSGHYQRKDLEIGAITKGLKQIARRYNISIVLLCQLSREVERRNDKRPMMSDLRESGNIEQDADLIMFLYRDDYYNKDSKNKNIAEIIVAKQRNGPVGTVEMVFIKEYGMFANLERSAI
ncbi:replicative DNA helicase [Sporolactobacillus sp. CQH2019]|uniref:replicative DNA helicase n=1 Tax=Sporolactobacillus sp. CQH2019 TaxID=3023512 RepID=UPI00236870E4|nr:replicative DNA helicase [Sporolactobacillus sp. CQH2019]MDD9149237.1 replicative DNA helicase [Sporolactobacillus sp. CQH2019]